MCWVSLNRDYVTWTLEPTLSYAWGGSAQAFSTLTTAAEAFVVRSALKNSPRSAAAIYVCVDQMYKSIGTGEVVLNDADAANRIRAGLDTAAQAGKCATSIKAALQESETVKVPTFLEMTERVGKGAGQVTAFETKLGKLSAYLKYVCRATPKFC